MAEEPVVCVSTGLDFVTLQVCHSSPGPPTAVELLNGSGWFNYPGKWIAAEHVECIKVRDGNAPLYHISILQIEPAVEYTVRLSWFGNPDPLLCTCRTAGRPPILHPPYVLQRWPTALLVEWSAPSPSGAPTLECQLEFCKDVLFAQWAEVEEVARLPRRDGPVDAAQRGGGDEELWRSMVRGLQPATDYLFRIRARNRAGWSHAFSSSGRGRSSDAPAPPLRLAVVGRRLGGVSVAFDVEDAEGAPVTSVQAETFSVMQWHASKSVGTAAGLPAHYLQHLPDLNDFAPAGVRHHTLELDNLACGVNTSIRLWAFSTVGRSLVPSEFLVCRPSDRPAPVLEMQVVGRWATSVEVEWRAVDPDGSPVEECSCQRGGYQLFVVWHDLPREAIRRAPGRPSHWRAKLEGLEPESCYVVRARAKNEVGWSDELASPLEAWTAAPPTSPVNFRCVKGDLNEVKLSFEVAVDPAQARGMAAVSEVSVEQAGLLVWNKLPAEQVKFEGGLTTWHATPGNMGLYRGQITILDLSPATEYSFRLWVANEIGWCRGLAPVVRCRTAMPPDAPTLLSALPTGPNAVELLWSVADPELPVSRCYVEIRESSVFSNWRLVQGSEMQGRRDGLCRSSIPTNGSDVDCADEGAAVAAEWEQLVDGLASGTKYMFRVRARNDVDMSKWSSEVCQSTPSSAVPTSCHLAKDPLCDATFFVTVSARDPPGAPVLVCKVTDKSSTRTILASHVARGMWQAVLPEGPLAAGLNVRLANAVGWGDAIAVPAPSGVVWKASRLAAIEASATPTIGKFVSVLVLSTADKCRRMEQRLERLLSQAKRSLRDRDVILLEGRATCAAKLSATLAELVPEILGAVDGDRFGSWPARCAACIDTWELATQQEEGLSIGAADAFGVLLEGAVWTERLCTESLEPAWSSICSHVHDAPRVFKLWAQERETWSARFQEQFLAVWLTSCVTALRLLAAASEKGPLGEAQMQLPASLNALRTLRQRAELQLRKLRRVAEMLKQVTEGGTSHGFEQVSVADKLSSSAFTLLLSAVLPVPGSLEVGAFSIGALWLEGDSAGRHAIVEHPRVAGAVAPMQRFRQRPTSEGARLLSEWADDRCGHSMLVHNATARVVTVRLMEGNEGLVKKAYVKIQQAHPYARWVASTVEKYVVDSYRRGNGDVPESACLPFVVVAPAGIARLPIFFVEGEEEEQTLNAEFAYGMGDQAERAVGRISARRGCAVSFVCFDNEVRVDNREAAASSMTAAAGEADAGADAAAGSSSGDGEGTCIGGEAASASAAAAAPAPAEEGDSVGGVASAALSVSADEDEVVQAAGTEVGGIEVEVKNNDFAQIKVSFYHPSTHIRLFEKPALSASVAPGETQRLTVPARRPASHVGTPTGPGTRTAAAAAASAAPAAPPAAVSILVVEHTHAFDEHTLLEVEVVGASGKKCWCNVIGGQTLSYEGCL
mmetsp:Transcript_169189/g.543875  ORF Transcript_169189/g.543875 Transcript_169189/m.543875 type:complete len:1453 (+) Transcript_169189:87-4445(+)